MPVQGSHSVAPAVDLKIEHTYKYDIGTNMVFGWIFEGFPPFQRRAKITKEGQNYSMMRSNNSCPSKLGEGGALWII